MSIEPRFTTKHDADIFDEYAKVMEELNDNDYDNEYLRSMYGKDYNADEE